MIGTDQYSYGSKLEQVDPVAKLIVTGSSIVLCLGSSSILTGAFTVAFFCIVLVKKSGIRVIELLRLFCAPLVFLLTGMIPVAFARFSNWEGVLFGLQFGRWIYGVSPSSLLYAARLMVRALGCVASVYFSALSTPITDMLIACKRLHIPRLLIALMELIYRFIFVLYETAGRIHTAQASRLGYRGIRQSYRSLGILISMVFMRAYHKSDAIYTALEARGYQGELCTLTPPYQSGRSIYAMGAGLAVVQVIFAAVERSLILL